MSAIFSYELPNGGLNTKTYINEEGKIKFDPPVYEQRYTTAIRILEDPRWGQTFRKVVDFGCAEMRLLQLLRRVDSIEHILEVDIDETVLRAHQLRAEPLVADYLQKRENPLRVEVLKGSITAAVENLRNVDAVIGLEIIEHLHAETLQKVPANIFGFVQPKIAIFSTPNCEFNVLFEPLLDNGFRHLDHKFEWNRAEFKQWALDICECYPNYSVAFLGVGKAPPDYKKVGSVTQMAIFARNDLLRRHAEEPFNTIVIDDVDSDPTLQYEEIYAVDFPFHRDERTKEEKIRDDLHYHIDRCRRVDRYYNRERQIYQIPVSVLLDCTATLGATKAELLEVLKTSKFKVERDFVELPEYDEDDESYRRFDDCFDDEYGWDAAEDAENDDELAAGCVQSRNDVTYDSEENWD